MKRYITLLLFSFVAGLIANAQSYTLECKWVDCGNNTQLQDPYSSPLCTFQWTGPSKKGKADGYGVATKLNKGKFESKYEGYYRNGIREGKGTFTHADGSVKTGEFVNGQLTGHGKMTTDDGLTYNGHFVNYRMHGYGTLHYSDGSEFVGFFYVDSPYTGKYTDVDGTVLYLERGVGVDSLVKRNSTYSPKIGKRITEYFDADWNRCEANDAAYYRQITYASPHTPEGVVKDYYITGELQSVQHPVYIDYEDDSRTFLEGEQIFYHKNGQVARKQQYYNNVLNGPSISYYEDGAIAGEANFVMGILHGDNIDYYPNGKLSVVEKYNYGQLYHHKYLKLEEDGTPFLVYYEDFVRNREAWEFEGQNGIVQVNAATSISMQAAPQQTISGGIPLDLAPMSDNVLSIATYQRNPGEGVVSFLFGFQDWDNMCAFSITGNKFQFLYRKNGVTVQCEDWQEADCIEPNENLLMVVNSKTMIRFYINDQMVKEVNRIHYDGSFCGLSLYNPSSEAIVLDASQLGVHEVIDDNKILQEYLPGEKKNDDPDKGNGSGSFLDQEGYFASCESSL